MNTRYINLFFLLLFPALGFCSGMGSHDPFFSLCYCSRENLLRAGYLIPLFYREGFLLFHGLSSDFSNNLYDPEGLSYSAGFQQSFGETSSLFVSAAAGQSVSVTGMFYPFERGGAGFCRVAGYRFFLKSKEESL